MNDDEYLEDDEDDGTYEYLKQQVIESYEHYYNYHKHSTLHNTKEIFKGHPDKLFEFATNYVIYDLEGGLLDSEQLMMYIFMAKFCVDHNEMPPAVGKKIYQYLKDNTLERSRKYIREDDYPEIARDLEYVREYLRNTNLLNAYENDAPSTTALPPNRRLNTNKVNAGENYPLTKSFILLIYLIILAVTILIGSVILRQRQRLFHPYERTQHPKRQALFTVGFPQTASTNVVLR